MPEQDYVWLPREDILHFEEIESLVDAIIQLCASKVRLMGWGPVLRAGRADRVARLAARPAIRDLAISSNGVLLTPHAQELRDARMQRLTFSLDTLQPNRFRELTRNDKLDRVLHGIA